MSVAHKISNKSRTEDVNLHENVDFTGLLLSRHVQKGLEVAGFQRPSPIQLKAIPLGRCGLDLIVQAKSGTGKTCVFTVIALESLAVNAASTQVLVLAPTREIALQIQTVIHSIGQFLPELKCHTFIGGMPLNNDIQKLKKCHIAVGTPGRIKQLIDNKNMKTDSIRLFILDEADKLLEENFQDQINWIYSMLPENKQMLALSATYPEYLAQHLTVYMRNPTFVRLNSVDPALLGIKQYYKTVPYHPLPHKAFEAKVKHLLKLFSTVSFNQCLLFSNYQLRAQSLCDTLNAKGWPSVCISGSLDQAVRLKAMDQLRSFQCRVLISTDLTARGIDAENVNIVINLDIPKDHETYLHRIGRAGRFGTYGVAITYINEGEEDRLREIQEKCNTRMSSLPDPTPEDLAKNDVYLQQSDVVTTETVITRTDTDQHTVSEETKVQSPEKTEFADTLDATDSCSVDNEAALSDISFTNEPHVIGNTLNVASSTVKNLRIPTLKELLKHKPPQTSWTFSEIQQDFLNFVKSTEQEEKEESNAQIIKDGHEHSKVSITGALSEKSSFEDKSIITPIVSSECKSEEYNDKTQHKAEDKAPVIDTDTIIAVNQILDNFHLSISQTYSDNNVMAHMPLVKQQHSTTEINTDTLASISRQYKENSKEVNTCNTSGVHSHDKYYNPLTSNHEYVKDPLEPQSSNTTSSHSETSDSELSETSSDSSDDSDVSCECHDENTNTDYYHEYAGTPYEYGYYTPYTYGMDPHYDSYIQWCNWNQQIYNEHAVQSMYLNLMK